MLAKNQLALPHVKKGMEGGVPHLRSSAISRVEYNPSARILSIWFVDSGGPYDYHGVPAHIYEGLLSASSAGSYFNDFIRDQYSVG